MCRMSDCFIVGCFAYHVLRNRAETLEAGAIAFTLMPAFMGDEGERPDP